jgi:multicomponent Na+:H+ antiporter subunit B
MEHHLVLRIISKLIIPLILIFALYVQFHGDYGPGGGFQAGVIFAAGFILYALIFGVTTVRMVLPLGLLRVTAALGLTLYICTGIAGLLLGGNFLDYNVLGPEPVAGQHLGIMLIELGVGVTVASVMMMIFYVFARP